MAASALLTVGIDYDQHLKNIEVLIERTVERVLERTLINKTAAAEQGGIELAMEVTRLSRSRIYNLVSEGSIPNRKRGNKLHFNRAHLHAWIEEGKRGVK